MGSGAVPPTVVRLRVNRVHSYGGEIASANPLQGSSHQYPGTTRDVDRLGLRSVLNHLEECVSYAVT